MSQSTFISLFSVTQSTSDVDKQIPLYQSFGFVVDDGYQALEVLPDEYFTARGIERSNLIKSVCLRQPADPYMHLILHQFKGLKQGPAWPAPFDQVGSRCFSMLVRDVAHEVALIRKGFPNIRFLHDPMTIRRSWGVTTTALFIDPEGGFVELIEIENGSPYDPSKVKAPNFDDVQWLHFMYNCTNYKVTKKFYESFGMTHDAGVNFRPRSGYYPTYEGYSQLMEDAFGLDQETLLETGFLRNEDDVSNMHLELMDYTAGSLKDPDNKPTWAQKGIARYCFKVPDYAGALAHQKARGTKIYVEDQRACLMWGNTQWFFFGDMDGNLLTQEQWYPTRCWGEKY
ncbi:uncharacterized protein Z518_00119 [Rhinocladiella mackenziei CBS 650.93]|uniref:VOC domain-containing protein n=1 Tax=Rhinocladiella mackenziei CBS 650.93 TaxID=1442369 RepID=A0A0D2J0A2_9EURO|nr:uncharacterized protein Z518_00119 [Rhinocladiella mackenziei CBS 650.93]KIX09041.1 hypothetical protein Z518_00119 [Rhinocladiella mackenziei CBS 650.93]